MTKPPSKQLDQFVLRLPDGMRDRIKAAAEANNRSMNAEIVARLERTLDLEETPRLAPSAFQAARDQLLICSTKLAQAETEFHEAQIFNDSPFGLPAGFIKARIAMSKDRLTKAKIEYDSAVLNYDTELKKLDLKFP